MSHRCHAKRPFQFGFFAPILVTFAITDTLDAQQFGIAANKAAKKFKNLPVQTTNKVAQPAPRSAQLTQETWKNISRKPIRAGEIDHLIAKELQTSKIEPAPLTTDEQFIRRIALDLTGQLPPPAEVEKFTANQDSLKRAKLIDKLLTSDDYAVHWARYWRDVIGARITDRRGLLVALPFERWMTERLKKNDGWDKIVRAMLTATGSCQIDDDGKNGALFFLAAHFGTDSAVEQAAEASRLFLGIQIQCAQCHDHPSDQWKRVQFHQLVGYFARLRERPLRGDGKPAGIQLVSLPFGEHEMPSKEDPKKTELTLPRFLDGSTPSGRNLSDPARRKALADAIVSKKNCWFAAAYVNRIWGDLMGQSFYEPIDDMGPQKPAVYGSVLTRLTGAFQGSDYNIKELFRAVMNSETYQRQIRLGDSSDQHLHFAAAYPTRLGADALWASLNAVLGPLASPLLAPELRKRLAAVGASSPAEAMFKQEFRFDPSSKADEVEGSVAQALMMMNNPAINQKIQAKEGNMLASILTANSDDTEAIKTVYLRTLARKPTDHELDTCQKYIAKARSRAVGFEDVLWALLNSTEFQTKR
jgi:hypothetical protein